MALSCSSRWSAPRRALIRSWFNAARNFRAVREPAERRVSHGLRSSSRMIPSLGIEHVAVRSIVAAAKQQRGASVACSGARLIEEGWALLGGDDASPRAIQRVLGEHDLALPRRDAAHLWQQLARERVGRDDHAPGDDAATVGCHVMTIGRNRSNPVHAHARIQLNATLQRCADHAADILERMMIRSIAGDEPTDEVGADVELLEDFPPRPELDALAVLGGEHDFLAHSLFLAVRVGEVDPSARKKIAIDRLVIDDLLKSIPVAKGHSQDQRRLPLAFGAKDFDRHRRETCRRN
jgi:hypothetical protein